MPQILSKPDWFEIMGRIEQGDAGALRSIESLVSNQLRSMCKPPPGVSREDVIQDVLVDLIRAWRSRSIREPDRFPGFVRTLASRRLADNFGRERRACALDRVETAGAEEGSKPNGENPSYELRLDARRALAKLDDTSQRTLQAVYGDGHTYQEACAILGVPLGTLKRRLSRSIGQLRDLTPGAGFHEEEIALRSDQRACHPALRQCEEQIRRDSSDEVRSPHAPPAVVGRRFPRRPSLGEHHAASATL